MNIPFNRPLVTGDEAVALRKLAESGKLGAGGEYTGKCEAWLRQNLKTPAAFLTASCSGALEMAVILAGVTLGDEVIMPSFTFPSMANAVALRGGVPVFVDIRPDTLNIDESLIEAAIGPRTKAIMTMHYAGVACDMERVAAIAERHGLFVIEDAAHALLADCRGRPLGSHAHMGAISFHETKNIHCGEGGALLLNDPKLAREAEIVRDKGTDRAAFIRGDIHKYSWVGLGSSYGPSELQAAWLFTQFSSARNVTARRAKIWTAYHEALEPLEREGFLRRPIVPDGCAHNAHIYYILLQDESRRAQVINYLSKRGIDTVFHFSPLHNSPAGIRYGRTVGAMRNTEILAPRLLRLPLWIGMERYVPEITGALSTFFSHLQGSTESNRQHPEFPENISA